MWTLSPETLAKAAETLSAKGGSVIAVSSGRTGADLEKAVAGALQGKEHGLVRGGFPRYPVLLDDADEVHVTADSAAMTSDAIASGKPVGLILPQKTASGRLFYRLAEAGRKVPVRDIRQFWRGVLERGLAGTVDRPRSADPGFDPLLEAVTAVKAILDR
jgi:hypothetical protein